LAEQEKRREQIARSLMGHRTKKAGRESESEGYEAGPSNGTSVY